MADAVDAAGINPSSFDIFEFVRQRKQAHGEFGLGRLTRLAQDLPPQPDGDAGRISWSIAGELGELGQPVLRLRIQAQSELECQRCLRPMAWPLRVDVRLQPVVDEAELDDEAPLDEEDFDADLPEKVLGSRRFDLLAQIEDELILVIPYVPRHEVCPDGRSDASTEKAPDERRPSPFAALAGLKRGETGKQ